ncbi:hypothetical protein KC331_g5979 [Hortaea werneckii]|nr:hypothetical protein KC331_g5979 [Hortaea werneckii]KAI7715676.1 hypothetical protein KC353_g5906 [Hortaea werneckii]
MATLTEETSGQMKVPSPVANDPTPLPGTTFPTTTNGDSAQPSAEDEAPLYFPGPTLQGRPTTVTLYNPAQLTSLAKSTTSDFSSEGQFIKLFQMINRSFSQSHAHSSKTGGRPLIPAHLDRLNSPEEFLAQVGSDEGTFVYIITYTSSDGGAGDVPVATAGAHRYDAPVLETTGEEEGGEAGQGRKVFRRVGLPQRAMEVAGSGVDVDCWELKVMAVDVEAQGQGLASYLMRLVDDEVKKRFWSLGGVNGDGNAPAQGIESNLGAGRRRLFMLLTTLKEINEDLYARRGYQKDYETWHAPGTLGSETGFTVVHMSREMGG